MNKILELFIIAGILVTGYYGLKNKDPKLLGLAAGKLLILGIINDKN